MRNFFLFVLLCLLIHTGHAQHVHETATLVSEAKATVLFDAFGKEPTLTKGWGYSVLINYKGKTILFDGGSNASVFQNNLTKKSIDPASIDMVVVSHSHYDHINGIDYLLQKNPRVKIYFPYDPFWGATSMFDARGQDSLVKDSLPPELRYFDGKTDVFPVPQSGGRFWNANIEYLKESKEIMPGVWLIVSSARYMGYFSRYPNNFTLAQTQNDCSDIRLTNLPELSLSLSTAKGQALFVGCSHSGVDTIAAQTKKETGTTIELLMGGFHLLPFHRQQTQKTVSYLKNELGVLRVAPGHCTGHLAFKLLKDLYTTDFIFAGLGEEIRF